MANEENAHPIESPKVFTLRTTEMFKDKLVHAAQKQSVSINQLVIHLLVQDLE